MNEIDVLKMLEELLQGAEVIIADPRCVDRKTYLVDAEKLRDRIHGRREAIERKACQVAAKLMENHTASVTASRMK